MSPFDINSVVFHFDDFNYGRRSQSYQGLINPLARRTGVVISTFGLAEIISCMPDGLVKIYIEY